MMIDQHADIRQSASRFFPGAVATQSSRRSMANPEPISILSRKGKKITGQFRKPQANAPALLVLHEWWGLNESVKMAVSELSEMGYLAFACDLYEGAVTTDAEKATALRDNLDPQRVNDILTTSAEWLRNHTSSNGKLGTIGWCLGGHFSLTCSTLIPVDATVIYYGKVDHSASQLAQLKGPVLAHFAERDPWFNHEMVDPFEAKMRDLGMP
jgi:carboxymethylenebutenolidase